MRPLGRKLLALGVGGGAALGLLIRLTPSGEAWLVALLAVSAALVALAQQTLP